jgi:hypothetical protein
MSVNKQVFWLRGRPTGFALPQQNAVALEAFVLVTAAQPRGIHTRFPILPKPWFRALIHSETHHLLCFIQRTTPLIDFRRSFCQAGFSENALFLKIF